MSYTISSLEKTYASLIVSEGVVLYPGQCLQIKSGPGTYAFAREIARAAYDAGALYVRIDIDDPALIRKRTEVQGDRELSFVPHVVKNAEFEMLANDWAYIRIDATEDRFWLSDADAHRLAAYRSATAEAVRVGQLSRMRNEHPWCVVCAVGPQWAKQVLGKDATTEDLWRVLTPILRLDHENPPRAWRNHAQMLLNRCDALNALQIDHLHFTSSQTDLTVAFTPEHRWTGGSDPLPNGTRFLANIPTEEVYSTPNRLTTEGYVTTTRPVSVMDSLVEDVRLEFSAGKVVSCSARVGQEIMESFLDTDEGARYLGEVALVDEFSPIAQSGYLFHSILYDENASCHLALGAGYPSCLAHGAQLNSDEKLLAAGCNRSLVHTDFMIGSADMHIDAYTRSGERISIMHEGKFSELRQP
jgi:aminopeptidase